jgi:hypothetical protein
MGAVMRLKRPRREEEEVLIATVIADALADMGSRSMPGNVYLKPGLKIYGSQKSEIDDQA